MKCKKCGRPLKRPQSSKVGYGPICYKRVYGSNISTKIQQYNLLSGDSTYCQLPGQMNIEEYLQIIGVI